MDLVHPSLYPVVYGRTESTSGEILEPREDGLIDPQFTSERFQWLPSDFRVAEDGSVSLASPYINNVHPKDQAELEKVIPKLLERVVPMFEWVLSDLRVGRKKQLPTRIDLKGETYPACVWEGHVCAACSMPDYPHTDQRHRQTESSMTEEDYEAIEAEVRRLEAAQYDEAGDDGEMPYVDFHRIVEFKHQDKKPKTWPESKPSYDGGLDGVKKTVDFRGKTMQVIVKLSNIVLTPEKPEYGGGTWHVDVMPPREPNTGLQLVCRHE